MVRWRRNEADAGRGAAYLGDPWIHFRARKLAALAGLGALGHLNLQFARIHQVVAGDTEAARRYLLDRAVARIAVGIEEVARRVLAALAGVAFRAEAVHGDGERLVGFA